MYCIIYTCDSYNAIYIGKTKTELHVGNIWTRANISFRSGKALVAAVHIHLTEHCLKHEFVNVENFAIINLDYEILIRGCLNRYIKKHPLVKCVSPNYY